MKEATPHVFRGDVAAGGKAVDYALLLILVRKIAGVKQASE